MDDLEKAIELSKQSWKQEEDQRLKRQSIEYRQNLIRVSTDGIHYIKSLSYFCPLHVQPIQHTFYYHKIANLVEIAGTFNGWNKEPMKFSKKNQYWYKKVYNLWPISYQYKYIINENIWEIDSTKPTKPDHAGNINNFITFGEDDDHFHEFFDTYLTGIGNEIGCFNYDGEFTPLLVRHTLGDGNCLCNAATLSIWGTNDTNQILRLCLRNTLNNLKSTLYPWYQAEFIKNSKRMFGSLEVSEKEILNEWESEEHSLATQSRYLSSFHTFLLCNVIRRPIILYSDESSILQGLGGIYFPWLWIDKLKTDKFKNPLAILYYENHYSLLVPTEQEGYYPIVTRSDNLLPIRFIPPNLKNKDTRDILKRQTNLKQIRDKTYGISFKIKLGSFLETESE